MSSNLTVAFSAVILALIAAAITFWVANVRRRWLAEEALEIAQGRHTGAGSTSAPARVAAAAAAHAAAAAAAAAAAGAA